MALHKITLMGGPPIINEEYKALEAITPGHLLEMVSSGVKKNTAAAANVAPCFALEREEMGNGIDVAYAVGDIVKTGTYHPGQRVYALLASGVNVAVGAYLTGDAAGLLTSASVAAGIRTARALEAVNTSGIAPVTGTRIQVEIV